MVFSVPQSPISKTKLIVLPNSDFWGRLRQQEFEIFSSMLAWETAIRGKSLCENEEKKGKNLSSLSVQSQTLGANVGVNQSWICPDGNCSFYTII